MFVRRTPPGHDASPGALRPHVAVAVDSRVLDVPSPRLTVALYVQERARLVSQPLDGTAVPNVTFTVPTQVYCWHLGPVFPPLVNLQLT